MENSRYETIEKELNSLISLGNKMLMSMAYLHGALSEKDKKRFVEEIGQPVDIENLYQSWYTEACGVIRNLIPDRYDDFILQY